MLFVGHNNLYARRTRKHQPKINAVAAKSDPLVKTDSIAPSDSLRTERDFMIKEMESPIDTTAIAMKSDSLQNTAEPLKKKWIPNPQKSLWLSLIIPGAGQIYNRKYWKLPLVYGGFVGCAYALTWNGKMYKDYSQAYQDIMSNNPNNDSYLDFLGPGATHESVKARLSYYQDLFKSRKDTYRRQRDLSIFAFIGVYVLSVIDAYVDAELSNFDITEDLSMKVEPTTFNGTYHKYKTEGVGLKCSFNF